MRRRDIDCANPPADRIQPEAETIELSGLAPGRALSLPKQSWNPVWQLGIIL